MAVPSPGVDGKDFTAVAPGDVHVKFDAAIQQGEDSRPPGNGDEQKKEKAAALAKALTTLSVKDTTAAKSAFNIAPTLYRFFKGKTYKALYTIEEIEAKLYDIQHHDSETSLLQQKSIISVDEEEMDEEEKHVKARVIRCFTDYRAKHAALVLLFNVCGSVILAPMTFIYDGTWSDPTPRFDHDQLVDVRTVMYFDLFLDLMYAGHLLLQLNMSFMHPTRRVEVTSRSKILWSCLMSPLYYLKWFTVTSYFWIAAFKVPLFLNLLKITRVVHWFRLPDPLWLFEDLMCVRLGRVVFLLVGLSHWVACILFWSGGFRDYLLEMRDSSALLRLSGRGDLEGSGHVRVYLMALVESLYMMTGALDNPLGEGSLRENNLMAFVIVLVFGPVGIIFVAYVIAAVVREQALMFALEIRHEENMAFVTRALENLNIPAELQRRVVSLHYFQKMSHDTEAFTQLFNRHNLSGPLEDAIRVYLYHKVLCSPFFTSGGPNYLLAVVRVLEDRMYLPGDYVARRGEVGAEMFFISRGELSVLVPGHESDDITNAVLLSGRKRKGQYFGEVALVKRSLRTAWVRAETYVIVSVLTREKIEDIWEFFPQEKEALVNTVAATMERDKSRQKKRWQDAVKEVAGTTTGHERHEVRETNPVPGLPLPRDSRISSGVRASKNYPGAFAVAALAMSGATRRSHLSHHLDDPVNCVQVLQEQEDRRHAQSIALAEQQRERMDALEQKVSSLVTLLGEALPAKVASAHESGKTKKKKQKQLAASGEEPGVSNDPEVTGTGNVKGGKRPEDETKNWNCGSCPDMSSLGQQPLSSPRQQETQTQSSALTLH